MKVFMAITHISCLLVPALAEADEHPHCPEGDCHGGPMSVFDFLQVGQEFKKVLRHGSGDPAAEGGPEEAAASDDAIHAPPGEAGRRSAPALHREDCVDDETWLDDKYGDGTANCKKVSKNKHWCVDYNKYSKEASKFCPATCNACPEDPTPAPTAACTDDPPGWATFGYGCADFSAHQWCSPEGTAGTGWHHTWGGIDNFKSQGVSALQACCDCGLAALQASWSLYQINYDCRTDVVNQQSATDGACKSFCQDYNYMAFWTDGSQQDRCECYDNCENGKTLASGNKNFVYKNVEAKGATKTPKPTPEPTPQPTPKPTPKPTPPPTQADSFGGGSISETDVGDAGGSNAGIPSGPGLDGGLDDTAPVGGDNVNGQAPASSVVGDPHVRNVLGEAFDINRPGVYELVRIPQDKKEPALMSLRSAVTLGDVGRPCGMYITGVTLTGKWFGENNQIKVRAFRRKKHGLGSAGQPFSIKVGSTGRWRALANFSTESTIVSSEPVSDKEVMVTAVKRTRRVKGQSEFLAGFFAFSIRDAAASPASSADREQLPEVVVAQKKPGREFLNVELKRLGGLGRRDIGGLLGVDRHSRDIEEPTEECKKTSAYKHAAKIRKHENTVGGEMVAEPLSSLVATDDDDDGGDDWSTMTADLA